MINPKFLEKDSDAMTIDTDAFDKFSINDALEENLIKNQKPKTLLTLSEKSRIGVNTQTPQALLHLKGVQSNFVDIKMGD